ncbi:cop9 subunit [Sporothrix brasiliensis 5110]|uniref:Cop9 subunit n=1 Tax=Sporothrix brasiliensis 5110 TaxID=1398154 RepID=A0A0C2F2D9_9PEZI|nr:cop9 subunit [Sporothrix brasiliensis 5110]KIH93084.1 cop9 subunit [Sporothrix brasiliensis 5110]
MEKVAATLLRFPPEGQEIESLSDDVYDQQIKIHAGRIQNLFKEHVNIIAAHATELLDSLDPAVHTYSYLALLDTIIPTEFALYASVQPVVANKIAALLTAFDPRQVRYIGSAFTHVFTAVGSGKIIPAPLAVELLAHALASIDPSGRMLTSNHLVLAKLAYHTNNAAVALPVLSRDIVFFPGMAAAHRDGERLSSRTLAPPSYISKDTGLTLPLKSTQVLEFDFVLGLLHLSVRAWAPAHAAFARVVSHPTRDNGASLIMVDAHKFWVLTGLLLFGHVANCPPQTSASASRICASINKLYGHIANAFQIASAETLQLEVAMGHDTLASDNTLSLATEVVAAHPKWQIAHLRRIYTTISVAAICEKLRNPAPGKSANAAAARVPNPDMVDDAAALSEADVTALIRDMIESGMIKAALRQAEPTTATDSSSKTTAAASSAVDDVDGTQNQREGGAYLEFLPEAEDMTEAEFGQRIGVIEARIQALKPLHAATEEHLTLNRDYIRQHIRDALREKDRAAAGDDDSMGGMLNYDVDPDEDLMMDGPEPADH